MVKAITQPEVWADSTRIVATGGALESKITGVDASVGLTRHFMGDWGDCDEEDRAANDWACKNGERVLSVYHAAESGVTFWIITEADRSVTTILLPEEY